MEILALSKDSHGSVSATHLVTVAAVALAGMTGFGALGHGMARGIADGGGEGSVMVTSAQAGLLREAAEVSAKLAEGSDGLRASRAFAAADRASPFGHYTMDLTSVLDTMAKAPELVLDPIAPATRGMKGAIYNADEVRVLRDAAHQLWLQSRPNYVGTRPLHADAHGLITVKLGDRVVQVGATPRLNDPRVLESIPPVATKTPEEAAAIAAQQESWLRRLDEAIDMAFARGHTATSDGARLPFSGVDVNQRYQVGMWRPNGVWQVHVHGSPEGFGKPTLYTVSETGQHSHGEWVTVEAKEIVEALQSEGYVKGEPILLSSCSAGACSTTGKSAAQSLAEAANAPVVAPSATHYRAESGAVHLKQESGRLGEWRIFQPDAWGAEITGKRVVMGRKPLENEQQIAAVNELWHAKEGSLERVEFAGDWERFGEDNEGALDAALRALEDEGRLVLRASGSLPTADFVAGLRLRGFDVKQAVDDGHATVVATKRSAEELSAAEAIIESKMTAHAKATDPMMQMWKKMIARLLSEKEVASLADEDLILISMKMPMGKVMARLDTRVAVNPDLRLAGRGRVWFESLVRRTILGEKAGDGSIVKRRLPEAERPTFGPVKPR